MTFLKGVNKLLLSFSRMSNLLQIAISAALCQDWQKAIQTNQSILKENKDDINSMNRLAHAFAQSGKLKEAKNLYKKILTIDRYNIIAQKNLDKLNSLPKIKNSKVSIGRNISATFAFLPSLFIEEPGKTKTVSLINTAPVSILSHLNPGDPIFFYTKKHTIDIRTVNKVYLGALPDDFAFKLLRFLKAGYKYSIYVKSTTKNSINVFIRETKRAKRYKSQPSFLSTSVSQVKSMFGGHKITNTVDEEDEEGSDSSHEDLEE